MSNAHVDVGVPQNIEEQEAFAEVLSRSLFFPPLSQHPWIETEGAENLRVVRVRGNVLGGLSVQNMGLWLRGQSLRVGAVRCVGVAPEARSQKLGRTLMTGCLAEMRDNNIPLSALYPATQPVYRYAGYEQAGYRVVYELPLHAINVRERGVTIQSHDLSDLTLIKKLYNQQAQQTSGHLDRNEWMWARLQRTRNPQTPAHAVVAWQDGVPQGYMIYINKPPVSLDNFVGQLIVVDWVSLTPEATDACWTFLSDHRSVNDKVQWCGSPSDTRMIRLANQDNSIKAHFCWLLRIVDLKAAMEQRSFPSSLEGELHLDVGDSCCPWNEGRWVCEFSGGKVSVSPGGSGRMKLSIRALASMYSGFLSPWEGRVAHGFDADDESLSLAAQAFAGPTPWMPEIF